jgi:hypothetical protein
MAEENGNGKGKFDWRMAIVIVAGWIALGLIQWGTTSTQIADHARRIELIENQLAQRSIAREEYERRHEDLTKQVEQDHLDIRELERRLNERDGK